SDDVPEIEVDRPRLRGVAEELDSRTAVDEVDEDQLPHLPPGEGAPRDSHGLARLRPRLEPLRFGPHRGYRHGVGEALRGHVRSLGCGAVTDEATERGGQEHGPRRRVPAVEIEARHGVAVGPRTSEGVRAVVPRGPCQRADALVVLAVRIRKVVAPSTELRLDLLLRLR